MERDAHYVAVGAFTLLVISMAVIFVVWYRDAKNPHDYRLYEIYFSGSVSGLTQGSPVRYLGVDVGRVQRLSLNKNRPDSVKVTAEIDAAAPVSSATRASLGLQGVTGLLYINLRQANGNVVTDLKQGEQYPIIESQSSDIDAFLSSLPELAGRITNVINSINKIFSEQNLSAINAIIKDVHATTANLPQTAQQLHTLLADLSDTAEEIKTTARSVRTVVIDAGPDFRQTMAQVNKVTDNLAQASQHLNQLMTNSEPQLNHFTEQGLYELERLLHDMRNAAVEFRELSRSLKETPSQLMFERPESGIEIKP